MSRVVIADGNGHIRTMGGFINRTLTYLDERGSKLRRSDSDIDGMAEPIVILGEPGIGKTELLRQIGTRTDTQVRSASAFVNHPKPASLISKSRLIIIDGLDELAAARDADPVNKVLRQLIIADCPRFIISCRSAEWRGASPGSLSPLHGDCRARGRGRRIGGPR